MDIVDQRLEYLQENLPAEDWDCLLWLLEKGMESGKEFLASLGTQACHWLEGKGKHKSPLSERQWRSCDPSGKCS